MAGISHIGLHNNNEKMNKSIVGTIFLEVTYTNTILAGKFSIILIYV